MRLCCSARVREQLLALAGREIPQAWIREHNADFRAGLTDDEGRSLDMIAPSRGPKRTHRRRRVAMSSAWSQRASLRVPATIASCRPRGAAFACAGG